MSTVIVGVIYIGFMIWATTHTFKDMKHSKCAGCSGSGCMTKIK